MSAWGYTLGSVASNTCRYFTFSPLWPRRRLPIICTVIIELELAAGAVEVLVAAVAVPVRAALTVAIVETSTPKAVKSDVTAWIWGGVSAEASTGLAITKKPIASTAANEDVAILDIRITEVQAKGKGNFVPTGTERPMRIDSRDARLLQLCRRERDRINRRRIKRDRRQWRQGRRD